MIAAFHHTLWPVGNFPLPWRKWERRLRRWQRRLCHRGSEEQRCASGLGSATDSRCVTRRRAWRAKAAVPGQMDKSTPTRDFQTWRRGKIAEMRGEKGDIEWNEWWSRKKEFKGVSCFWAYAPHSSTAFISLKTWQTNRTHSTAIRRQWRTKPRKIF